MTDCFLDDDPAALVPRDPSLSARESRLAGTRDFLLRDTRLATSIPRLVLFPDQIAAPCVHSDAGATP